MVCYANGSTSRLSYIVESTRGTTPAGDFTKLPFNTHSLELQKARLASEEMHSDRMLRVDRHGNKSVSGDITTELRADVFDDWLEAALMSTWDTTPTSSPDTLKVGNTLKTFSVEDYDSTIDYSRIFTAVTPSSTRS